MMTANGRHNLEDAREFSALRSTALGEGEVPKRVLLTPWGSVESTNGSFVVDEESVEAAVKAFAEHATDLPIDYEHQTLGGAYSSPSGQAPAAGWVKRITGEAGVGLFAEIEWTQQATEMLAAKQYRYLSPVAIIRKSDRKLVAIHSAALTNKPAIVGMEPIVNRGAIDSGDDECTSLLCALRAELGLHGAASAHEVLTAVGKKLAELKREAQKERARQRVGEALRAGKLVEAQRTWAEALIALEEDLFDEWFRTAPVVVEHGRISPPTQDGAERDQLARARRARAEFRANSVLAGLTSEEAYVRDACRAASC